MDDGRAHWFAVDVTYSGGAIGSFTKVYNKVV